MYDEVVCEGLLLPPHCRGGGVFMNIFSCSNGNGLILWVDEYFFFLQEMPINLIHGHSTLGWYSPEILQGEW